MQNLGKADRTMDETFEEHMSNFNAQQMGSTRVHSDVSNYLRSLKTMQKASKNLMKTLQDVYEEEWTGKDILCKHVENNDVLYADLTQALTNDVIIPLNTYQGQFPEMRKKIEKRGRKLIDYDKERHNVETMQNNPNRNEIKFEKAKEQMENARRTYEQLNLELHEELPALYESRIPFLVSNMKTLVSAEEAFHTDKAKVFTGVGSAVDKLATEVQNGNMPIKSFPLTQPISPPSDPIISNSPKILPVNSLPKGATADNLPPGVLYMVEATYKYDAEDTDELNFEAGEIIHVVEYDDPDEQEEGWRMGIMTSTNQKGLFPTNFTRPI